MVSFCRVSSQLFIRHPVHVRVKPWASQQNASMPSFLHPIIRNTRYLLSELSLTKSVVSALSTLPQKSTSAPTLKVPPDRLASPPATRETSNIPCTARLATSKSDSQTSRCLYPLATNVRPFLSRPRLGRNRSLGPFDSEGLRAALCGRSSDGFWRLC